MWGVYIEVKHLMYTKHLGFVAVNFYFKIDIYDCIINSYDLFSAKTI